MHTVRLRVTLREVTPAVLRVLDVPASCTLTELHDLLQIAIGWTDSHLHQFVVPADVSADVGDVLVGLPHADDVERVLIDRTVVAQLADPHAVSSPHDQFVGPAQG